MHGVELWALKTSQPAKIGVFTNGYWYLDANQSWDWSGAPPDVLGILGLGQPGAIPVVGDWSGDGTTKIGVYVNGEWYLDMNNNGQWDGEGVDVHGVFGIGLSNPVPVTGDWNGDGITEIGIYSDGNWYLDKNRSWAWEGEPADTFGVFGIGLANPVPVTGDWNGDGITEIGIYSDGNWYLDKNRSWAWEGEPADTFGVFGIGLANPIPVTGDWDGSGITKIGIYTEGNWYLDTNASWQWDGTPTDTFGVFGLGLGTVVPVTGNW
jgi:peptidoglycan hydrolase-like protein with peptidoglycan-binding domain